MVKSPTALVFICASVHPSFFANLISKVTRIIIFKLFNVCQLSVITYYENTRKLVADYLMIYCLIRLTPTNKLTHAVDRCHHKVNDDIVYSAKMVVLVIFLFKSY